MLKSDFLYFETPQYDYLTNYSKQIICDLGSLINKSSYFKYESYLKKCSELKIPEDIDETSYEDISIGDAYMVEQLLGTVFVFCQTYITSVIAEFKDLKKRYKEYNIDLPIDLDKETFMRLNQKLDYIYINDKFSAVQLIDAAANYFKHHDEWDSDWNNPKTRFYKTCKIIQSVDSVNENCEFVLIEISKALGNYELNNTIKFLNILLQWHTDLIEELVKQVKPFDYLFQ